MSFGKHWVPNTPTTTNNDEPIATAIEASRSLIVQPTLKYDYTRIVDADLREDARRAAGIILRANRDVERGANLMRSGIFMAGAELSSLRPRFEHGQWLEWLETEFALDPRQAQYYISVHERFGGADAEKYNILSDTALKLLAAPRVPEPVAQQVADQAVAAAQNGDPMPTRAIQSAIKAQLAESAAAPAPTRTRPAAPKPAAPLPANPDEIQLLLDHYRAVRAAAEDEPSALADAFRTLYDFLANMRKEKP